VSRDTCKEFFEICESHWLGEMMVKSGFGRQYLVSILTPTSLRNDWYALEEFVLSKCSADLIAIHAWQSNIKQNDVWPKFSCRL
jgi:hypothetical protein